MAAKEHCARWIVVLVWRGIPVNVFVYQRQCWAIQRAHRLRASLSADDEVAVFRAGPGTTSAAQVT